MKVLMSALFFFAFAAHAQAGCSKPIKCNWTVKYPDQELNAGEICLPVYEQNELGTIYSHTLNAGELTINVVKRKAQPGAIELVIMADASSEISGSDIPATGNDQFQIAFGGDLMVAKRTIVKKHTKKFQFVYKNGNKEHSYNCRF